MHYWVRGEIYDVQCLTAAITHRTTTTVAQVTKLRNKITNQQAELDNLKGGKSNYKTFFKSSESRNQYAMQLEHAIAETQEKLLTLERFNAILDHILLKNTVPQFHASKLENFTAVVREMAAAEASNHANGASFWSKVQAGGKD